ncbi:MAG: hypothetical protein Q9224_002451 [Gallowayella concinna]
MRQLINWSALAIILFLPSFCLIVSAAAYTPNSPHDLPLKSLPPFHQQPSRTRSVFSRVRDGLIRSIWSVPCTRGSQITEAKRVSSSPPSTLLARYGGDVVLRFDINSPEEATALADAVNVLFLDVWEFNTDWADIRLAKDVVSHFEAVAKHRSRLLHDFID